MTDSIDEKKALWLGLHLTPGLGAVSFWRLVDHFGSAKSVLTATNEQLLEVPRISQKNIKYISSPEATKEIGAEELRKLELFGAFALFPNDPEYPKLLLELRDCPPVLFGMGDVALANIDGVGIVGSRASTSYGRKSARTLSADIARMGISIVSGMALGIDSEAHKGALDVGGKTVGVLGCGLDVVYPRQNSSLFQSMRNHGLLLTEYPFSTQPDAFRFPARNRIIAGMSKGVLVVEAAKKSGSLITAQMALDANREVFAIPGQIDSFKSEGTHWLLKQGAKLVQSANDVLEELQFSSVLQSVDGNNKRVSEFNSLDQAGCDPILDLLEPYPISRDELVARAKIPIEKINEILLLLEIDGMVEMLPGDEIRRIM